MSNQTKISIFYFSGTGNTKVVCEQLSSALQKEPSHEVSLTSIEALSLTQAVTASQESEYIGIAFPIYGFGAPKNILAFSEDLAAQLKGPKKIFILMTAGDFIGVNHAAAQKVIGYFEKKGHPVVYERIIAMASNFLLPYEMAFNKQLYEVAQLKTAHMALEMMSGKKRRLTPAGATKIFARLMHKGESEYGAAIYGKSLKSDDTCTGCGLCVKKCPVSNLSLHDKQVAGGKNCIMCMRCVYGCPSQSLKSKGMGFVILKAGYNIESIMNHTPSNQPFVHQATKGFYRHFYKYVNDVTL